MDNDLTILLLLKDRAEFTERWLEYTEKTHFPYAILIADGSEGEENEKILLDKRESHRVDYEYIRYPHDKDARYFRCKIAHALSRVTTPYVVLASNDDFYFLNGLRKATAFLKSNPDYISARGEIDDFTVQGEIRGRITSAYPLYLQSSVEAETALERVRLFSAGFHSIWHEVFRTKAIEQIYKEVCELNVLDLELSSHLVYLLIAASGKIYRNRDFLFMLHQCSSGSTGIGVVKKSPSDWIEEHSWPDNFHKLIHAVAAKIADTDSCSPEEVERQVLQCYLVNVIGRKFMSYTERKASNKSTTMIHLSHLLNKNNAARTLIKKYYKSAVSKWQQMKGRRTMKSSPYYKEIMGIEDFLRQNEK